ncbi:hypothetical protein [Flavobacterium psychraquaticum]|uniref:hypothetical protein n=1 Tax=Flavobacterium psychraquaticum TaxID=3103958 RepID=UPI002ACD9D25|nr:hypothetical protein [Flavobacterium sp. LB-N7T]
MNLIFNEISILPVTASSHTLRTNFINLLKVYELAKKDFGFKHLVFPQNIGQVDVTTTQKFIDWIYELPSTSEKNNILSVLKRPFGNDVLEEQVEELNKYYFNDAQNGIPDTYCNGMAVAHVKENLCISLSTNVIWDKLRIDFYKITNDDLDIEDVSVNNISNEVHFQNIAISSFIQSISSVTLAVSTIPPGNKSISLRDDHGKNILLAFSNRLVMSEYVVSVINSLPFNPRAVNLIKRIYNDGKIELVLYWEDKGIGIIIQTTGRNYKETEEIAKLLKEQYDR